MGLGNGNSKSGNKGSNHNYEHRHLLSLGNIAAALGPLANIATEPTLQMVLAAIQNGSEFEAKLVEDNVGVTWLEVRTWNTALGTWNAPEYYAAGSNTPGSPTLPINYVNPTTLLSTIASNTTGINLEATQQNVLTQLTTLAAEDFATETTLSTLSTWLTTNAATEVTLSALNAKLNTLGQKTSVNSTPVVLSSEQEAILSGISTALTDVATETTLGALLTAFNSEDFASEASLSALLTAFGAEDFASETTLTTILAQLDVDLSTRASEATLSNIDAKLVGSARTVSVTTATVDGSTSAGVKEVTLWFRGGGGTLDGEDVPNGTRYTFSAIKGEDTINAIAYTVPTGGAGEVIITELS